MRAVFSAAAEALLWPLGVRRRRRRGPPALPPGPGGPPSDGVPGGEAPEDEETWEVDPVQFIGALAGATLAWWVLNRGKDVQSGSGAPAKIASAAAQDGLSSAASTAPPRIALSEFLSLLRGGAVTAVTYLADRPPAGSLVVKTALPAAAALATAATGGLASGSLATSTGSGAPPLTAMPYAPGYSRGLAGSPPIRVVETLLMPGCHQGVFEELRGRDILFECAEVNNGSDASGDIGWLSLLIDIGGLVASVAALAYLFKGSNQGLFTGRHLEDAAADTIDKRPAVTFDDVAGMETTKEELREVIAYLRNPGSFYALGARPPRGILLAGPSGTGKTLLARAVAGEAGVPFLYASSASFVEIFVGQGAQRIRQFFEQARGCAPCIVFLDELDAVGAARQVAASGGNQEYAQTLNQLLLELDGIESQVASDGASGSAVGSRGAAASAPAPQVVTMAATNRYDCLDEALVRPGRLDRIVLVSLPNLYEREATLRIHASKLQTDGLQFQALARRTEGSSGADLANLLNEAALLAARRRADAVRMEHVNEVLSHPRPQQRPQGTQGEDPTGVPGGAAMEMWGRALAAAAAMAAAAEPSTRQSPVVVSPVD